LISPNLYSSFTDIIDLVHPKGFLEVTSMLKPLVSNICGMSNVRDTHALQQMFSAAIEHGHTPGGSIGQQLQAL
jgi:hypothetical protein